MTTMTVPVSSWTIEGFNNTGVTTNSTTVDEYLVFEVDFPVYIMAFFGWVGWWLFAVFVGVGLTALPFDLICSFIYRPVSLAPAELASKEMAIRRHLKELLEISRMLIEKNLQC